MCDKKYYVLAYPSPVLSELSGSKLLVGYCKKTKNATKEHE
jgi:hypothetical protein